MKRVVAYNVGNQCFGLCTAGLIAETALHSQVVVNPTAVVKKGQLDTTEWIQGLLTTTMPHQSR